VTANFALIRNANFEQFDRWNFAARVRAARAALNWTQSDLGRRAGITQRSINRLEQEKVDVRYSTVMAIERAFREAGISFLPNREGGFEMRVERVSEPK
jgi:transcriptional regulator with XRE-family HTH domain